MKFKLDTLEKFINKNEIEDGNLALEAKKTKYFHCYCWMKSKKETCDWNEKWSTSDEFKDPESWKWCSDGLAWVGKWCVKNHPETFLIFYVGKDGIMVSD